MNVLLNTLKHRSLNYLGCHRPFYKLCTLFLYRLNPWFFPLAFLHIFGQHILEITCSGLHHGQDRGRHIMLTQHLPTVSLWHLSLKSYCPPRLGTSLAHCAPAHMMNSSYFCAWNDCIHDEPSGQAHMGTARSCEPSSENALTHDPHTGMYVTASSFLVSSDVSKVSNIFTD